MTMRKIQSILILVISTLLLPLFLSPKSFSFSVPEEIQVHDQWCWAASSWSVLKYYGTVAAQTQCDIANWAMTRNDCCDPANFSWPNYCNWWTYTWGPNNGHDVPGGSVQGILTQWGVSSNRVVSALSWTASCTELDQKRPFIIRWGWTRGGGHFLVGYGYDQNGQFLDIMDPWPGHGYMRALYSSVVNASDHTWTSTLQITTPAPQGGNPILPPTSPVLRVN